MSTPRAVILVNRLAGGGRRLDEVRRLTRSLIAHHWAIEVLTPNGPESLEVAVRQSVDSGAQCIVVAGGDGTWHYAIQSLAGTSTPTALLAIGTGDDNARSLGFPRHDPERLGRCIAEGRVRSIDLGRLESSTVSRWFSGVASVGFDSQVNERANAYERLPGTLRYLVAAAAELRGFSPGDYRFTVDGESHELSAMLMAVGNGGFYGGGMAICPDARTDDGYLDATILTAMPIRRFLAALPLVYRGTHVRRPEVDQFRGRELAIDSPGHLVFADGEPIGRTPVSMQVVPDALRIVDTRMEP